MKVTAKDLYNNIAEELSSLGIFIDKKDIFILVYIVLKNIKDTCRKKDRIFLAKDKKISARLVGEYLKLRIDDSICIKNKRLRMTDTVSEKMFQEILFPSMEVLLEDLEE